MIFLEEVGVFLEIDYEWREILVKFYIQDGIFKFLLCVVWNFEMGFGSVYLFLGLKMMEEGRFFLFYYYVVGFIL